MDQYSYQYPEFAQNQQNQAADNLKFWADWYGKYNPQGPVLSSQSSTPGFQQGAATAAAAGSGMAGLQVPGGSGNLDTSALARNLNNKAMLQGGSTDIGNYLSDFNQNAARSNEYGSQGFQRMGEAENVNQLANYTLPMMQYGSSLRTQDFVNSLRNLSNYEQGNPLDSVLGSAGSFLGGKVGNATNPLSNPALTAYMNTPGWDPAMLPYLQGGLQ